MEKLALASVLEMAPTVMAFGVEAGEWEDAFSFSLPAATTTVTPVAMVFVTAVLRAVESAPPRDMERTDLVDTPSDCALVATHWMPEMTPDVVPEPSAARTLTATRVALLETP